MRKSKKLFKIIAFVVLSIVLLLYLLLPFGMGIVTSFRQTAEAPAAPEGFESVQLTASDGIALSAWWAPSRNGAAILLVHGSNGSLDSLRSYADMLESHGYGVLALCLRGHGSSGGGGNALGWECGLDVAAAVDYLDVNGVNAIGALGLSLGGEVLLSACGDLPQLKAVAADGATHHTLDDYLTLPLNQSIIRNWTTRVMYFSAGIFTGQQPPKTTILDSVKNAKDARFLFIAAQKVSDEVAFDSMYHQNTESRSELWIVPGAGHTQAFSLVPDEYEERVTAFFDGALGVN